MYRRHLVVGANTVSWQITQCFWHLFLISPYHAIKGKFLFFFASNKKDLRRVSVNGFSCVSFTSMWKTFINILWKINIELKCGQNRIVISILTISQT